MAGVSPRTAAAAAPVLPLGDDERIAGSGVMGLAFGSGDYLSLRCMTPSFGDAYTAVWHRDAEGEWGVYTTTDPEHSCERYIGAACARPSTRTAISVDWLDDWTPRVTIPGVLAVDDRPQGHPHDQDDVRRRARGWGSGLWDSRPVLAGMGRMSGPALGVGKVRLSGKMPNGQGFTAAPVQIWAVEDSRATLHGRDLGSPQPLARQARLGGFWLPQRGIFMCGFGHFEAFDARRHVSATSHNQELLAPGFLSRCGTTRMGVCHVGGSGTRRTELLAALSIAIDLGLGQPAEHVLRSSIIATRLADRLGLGQEQRDAAFHTTLVMWIGCHAESHEYVRWFGDDIAVKQQAYLVDWSGVPYMRFLVGHVAHGSPLPQRLKVMAQLMRNPKRQLGELVHSHCASAALLAAGIGLPAAVQTALAATFERYDGQGGPAGLAGDEIPVEMRVAQVADLVEVHDRTYGAGGAELMVRSRRGGQFDPSLADAFLADPDGDPGAAGRWRPLARGDRGRPRSSPAIERARARPDARGHRRLRRPEVPLHARALARRRRPGGTGRRPARPRRRGRHDGAPGGPRPRHRPDRRHQPHLGATRSTRPRPVGEDPPPPLPERADPRACRRPRDRRAGRCEPPRAARRGGVPQGPHGRRAADARPGARRRRRVRVRARAAAVPGCPGCRRRGLAAARASRLRSSRPGRRRGGSRRPPVTHPSGPRVPTASPRARPRSLSTWPAASRTRRSRTD